MNPHADVIERLAELAELGHSASAGFIRQVAEDAAKALATLPASDSAVPAGGDAQLNLYRQAERDRRARRSAEEAFDLIAPFVKKFAEAAKHYDGGRPEFEGSVNFKHDADPSYRPALATTVTGLGGPGAPVSPTLGDLRLLSEAYAMAAHLRAAAPKVASDTDDMCCNEDGTTDFHRSDSEAGEDLIAGVKRALQDPDGEHDGWTDHGLKHAFFRWPTIVHAINAALAETKVASDTGAGLRPDARTQRAGEHLFKKAREDGWLDDGEGAYEYMIRRAYEAGMRRATPGGDLLEQAAKECRNIADNSMLVLDGHDARVRHEGIVAGAQACERAVLALKPAGDGGEA